MCYLLPKNMLHRCYAVFIYLFIAFCLAWCEMVGDEDICQKSDFCASNPEQNSRNITVPSPPAPLVVTAASSKSWSALFTHKLIHERRAAFALDVAAPVELAVAPLHYLGLVLVITSAAAHQLTPIHALWGLVAKPPHCAQRACALVLQAVVWTLLDVHQVMVRGRVEPTVHLHQLSSRVEFHGYGTVILLLQCIAHLAEVGQLQPAGLQAAGTWYSVALAGHVGKVWHNLEKKKIREKQKQQVA